MAPVNVDHPDILSIIQTNEISYRYCKVKSTLFRVIGLCYTIKVLEVQRIKRRTYQNFSLQQTDLLTEINHYFEYSVPSSLHPHYDPTVLSIFTFVR
jgi:hypothetical protein